MEVQDKDKQAASASVHTQLDPSRSACGPESFAEAGQAGRMQGPCDIASKQKYTQKGTLLTDKNLSEAAPSWSKTEPQKPDVVLHCQLGPGQASVWA